MSAGRSERRPGPGVVGLLLVLLGSVWAGFSAGYSPAWGADCYGENVCDSLTFAVVGELLQQGLSPYDADLRETHISRTRLSGGSAPFVLPFQYPPNALPWFAIRGWMSPRTGHVVVSVVSTAGFLYLLLLLIQARVPDEQTGLLLLACIGLSRIVAFNAQLAQTGAVAAALVVGVVWWWRRSPVAAGLVLGMLAFKPQYAVPIGVVALLTGNWRVWTAGVVSLAALSVVSGLAFGFDLWRSFFEVVGEPNHTAPYMINWMGLAARLVSEQPSMTAAIPVFLLGIGAWAVCCWTWRGRRGLEEGLLTTAVAMTLVVNPNTHPYDLLVLAPSLVYVASRAGSAGVLVGPTFFGVTWIFLPAPSRWVLAVGLIAFAAFCAHVVYRDRDLPDPSRAAATW